MKFALPHFISLIAILGIFLVTACDSPTPPSGAQSPDSTSQSPGASTGSSGTETKKLAQSAKPVIDSLKTWKLLTAITSKRLGETMGRVEAHTDGILIAPGATPTTVSFNLANRYGRESLAAWILPLSPERAADIDGGTVAFEVIVDGSSKGRWHIDRSKNEILQLDLTGARQMDIVTDNDNGSAQWDLSLFGLQ